MPKPTEMMGTAAALLNDADQEEYTNSVLLPYFNLALHTLQELYEQNNIPATNTTSAAIRVKAGISEVGFDTTPALPSNLIEIEQLWESQAGQEAWIPLTKQQFLPHYLQDNTFINQFLVWAWKGQRICLIPANADNDLKIDYICSLFTMITTSTMSVNLPYTNIKTYLEYKTAALSAMFIAEDTNRALALDALAGDALTRALGIPIKGTQSIVIRRRPFRASFKRRGLSY